MQKIAKLSIILYLILPLIIPIIPAYGEELKINLYFSLTPENKKIYFGSGLNEILELNITQLLNLMAKNETSASTVELLAYNTLIELINSKPDYLKKIQKYAIQNPDQNGNIDIRKIIYPGVIYLGNEYIFKFGGSFLEPIKYAPPSNNGTIWKFYSFIAAPILLSILIYTYAKRKNKN